MFSKSLVISTGISIFSIAVFANCALANDAIEVGVTGGVGYEKVDNADGVGFNAELQARSNGFTASIEIVDVFITGKKNSGFYRDQFSNGQSRCRNASNGQFANDSQCSDVGLSVGFLRTADLTYSVPLSDNSIGRNNVFGGVGTSLNSNLGFYGVIGYENNNFQAKAKIGSNITDVRIGGFWGF
jgi:hypothetical protein